MDRRSERILVLIIIRSITASSTFGDGQLQKRPINKAFRIGRTNNPAPETRDGSSLKKKNKNVYNKRQQGTIPIGFLTLEKVLNKNLNRFFVNTAAGC